MIAGQLIRYLPGTSVVSGGYMLGYITTTNEFCNTLPPLTAASNITGVEYNSPGLFNEKHHLFTICPNPTADKFKLVFQGDNFPGTVKVEIMDMQGNRILRSHMMKEPSCEFRLGGHAPGLYLVKVTMNNEIETFKVILNK
jgi:hypothetical protein